MLANYGYSDGSGNYFITIDTEKCNRCGDCVAACPSGAAKQHLFGDEQINEELEGLMNYA